MNKKCYGVYDDMSETAGKPCFYLIKTFQTRKEAEIHMKKRKMTAVFPMVILELEYPDQMLDEAPSV